MALVPPVIFRTPLLVLAALIDTRILSTDVWVSAQPTNAFAYLVVKQLLNILAGKVVSVEIFCQALSNPVPDVVPFTAAENTSAGKLTILVLFQALLKIVPAAVLINGNEVRLVHAFQALAKLVPAAVLINGNEVRPEQLTQA